MNNSLTIALIAVLAISACTAGSDDGPTTSATPVPATQLQDSSTSTPRPDVDLEAIEGIWLLVSYEIDGESGSPEVGVNTASIPWIQFTSRGFEGNAGCNGFRTDSYTLEDGVLEHGQVAVTLARCMSGEGGDLMDLEHLLLEHLLGEVVLDNANGQHMELNDGAATLRFEATDSRPAR